MWCRSAEITMSCCRHPRLLISANMPKRHIARMLYGPWQQRRLMAGDMFRQRRLSQQRSIRSAARLQPATTMSRQVMPCRRAVIDGR